MEKPYMDPWPNLYSHSNTFDYQKDVRTAGNIAINIQNDIKVLLQNMRNQIEFNLNKLITIYQNSEYAHKDEVVKNLKKNLAELHTLQEKIDKHQDNLTEYFIHAVASINEDHVAGGGSDLFSLDAAYCADLTVKLIGMYAALGRGTLD